MTRTRSNAGRGGPGMTRAGLLGALGGALAAATPRKGEAAMPDGAGRGFAVPAGSCDCHVHVFEPDRFPYAARRGYTPGPASVDDLLAFEARLGMGRFVIVQPSVYGADDACLLAAPGRLGERARGVAAIDPERTPDAELDTLAHAGVRSVRVNLEAAGNRDPRAVERAFRAAAERVAPRGWSIQVYASLPVIAELGDEVLRLPVPLVADHFAGARGRGGPDQPGFAALLAMLRSGRVWVKLSAPYPASPQAPTYADMAPIAPALIGAAPERMLWASDWPHTGGGATGSNDRGGRSLSDVEPFRQVDVPDGLRLLRDWSGDAATWRRILVDNPAGLYGFGA